ncbi:MAG: hydroxyacylglutathione hydrolase [Polyangiaceae bacterium]
MTLEVVSHGAFEVTVVPCLRDNYAYVVRSTRSGFVAVVDPSEDAPIVAALATLPGGARLDAIWATHHHHDHVGGIEVLVATFGAKVVGHASESARIPRMDVPVEHGDAVPAGDLDVSVLHVPGHTRGAVTFVVRGGDAPAAFTGDTLFLAGCGRMFEGDPETMFASMRTLAALPGDSAIYCGHEYTVANLAFATQVEPSNADVGTATTRAAARRAEGRPTVPGTVAEELRVNPFLRAADAATFGARRRAKDAF